MELRERSQLKRIASSQENSCVLKKFKCKTKWFQQINLVPNDLYISMHKHPSNTIKTITCPIDSWQWNDTSAIKNKN